MSASCRLPGRIHGAHRTIITEEASKQAVPAKFLSGEVRPTNITSPPILTCAVSRDGVNPLP